METLLDDATLTTFRDVALAAALGLLIGIEREWSVARTQEGTGFAGARTFTLAAL